VYSTYKLDNGLTVLLVPNPTSQAVVVDAFVKVGSRNEEEHINGISHFLEHLNFKGTKNYSTAKGLSEAIDSVGGVMNANTGKEHTQYYAQVESRHIVLAFDVVTDLFRYPTFKPAEIEKEKGVIIEEINMYLDTPQHHIMDMLEEGMWDNHSLGRNIAGSPAHVRAITKKDITDYRRNFYNPKNTIVAVAGKFDEEEVRLLVSKYWSDYKGKEEVALPEKAEGARQKKMVMQSKQTNQAHFAIGFRGFDYNDTRNYAMDILSAVLSGGMSGRLFTEVREKRGLAYYIDANHSSYQDVGAFIVRAGVEIGKIDMSLEVVIKELKKMRNNLLTLKEMRKAKEYLKGTVALSLEGTSSKMSWCLQQLAFAKKVEEPTTWMKKIDAVTPQEVRKAAQAVIRGDLTTLAVIGPYSDKDKSSFEQIISRL